MTVSEVAASIGAGLARAALAGSVNGKLVDTSTCIATDSDLTFVPDKDAEGRESIDKARRQWLCHASKEGFQKDQCRDAPWSRVGLY